MKKIDSFSNLDIKKDGTQFSFNYVGGKTEKFHMSTRVLIKFIIMCGGAMPEIPTEHPMTSWSIKVLRHATTGRVLLQIQDRTNNQSTELVMEQELALKIGQDLILNASS